MKNKIRVFLTEPFIILGSPVYSCKGKLVLTKTNNIDEHSIYVDDISYRSIIISEKEKIMFQDLVLDNESKVIKVATTAMCNTNEGYWSKILAMPDNFTPNILQLIHDGDLKDGDEIILKCDAPYYKSELGKTDGFTTFIDFNVGKFTPLNILNGKWFYYWKKVQGRICNSDYKFITGELGDYLFNDKEAHLSEVEDWARKIDDCGNYTERGFEYGFDDIEAPPKIWAEKKINNLMNEIEEKKIFINLLKTIK